MQGIKFTPLSGAHDEGPLCYLLEMEHFTMLLDCGWDDHFDVSDTHIRKLKQVASHIDIILLSHADIAHVGALPYLIGKLGCKAQIFSSLPVCKMGKMFMYDMYKNYENVEDVERELCWDLEDVDAAFGPEQMVELQHSERHRFDNGLVIAAYPAGHSLGGSVWRLSKELEEIVYAVDFNHRKERHLNGTILGDKESSGTIFGRPSLLITDAYNMLNKAPSKSQDAQIIERVITALRDGGNVLLPTDTASRVFELMLVLDQLWSARRDMQGYGLAFLSNVSDKTVDFASRQLEWMSDAVMRNFDENRENPFQFKNLKLCSSLDDLSQLPSPMIVMATSHSLEVGFARELFVKWAPVPSNLILFTERSFANSLSRTLINEHMNSPAPCNLTLDMKRRVLLEGQELEEYQKKRRAEEEAEKKRQKEEEMKKNVIEIRDAEDLEDEDVIMSNLDQNKITMPSDMASHSRLFLPHNMRYVSQHLMFPCIEQTPQFDEYGLKIDIEELRNRSYAAPTDDMEHNAKGFGEVAAEENKMDEESVREEIPTKYVEETINIDVMCHLMHVDFEGRSNKIFVHNILRQINARNIIIIHGEKRATKDLAQFCEKKTMAEVVAAPQVGETSNIRIDINMFKVHLQEELLNQLQFVKYGAFDMTYLEGEYQVDPSAMDIYHQLQEQQQQQDHQELPLATIALSKSLPDENALSVQDDTKGHKSLLVGDVKLNQFKQLLVEKGFRAIFHSTGVLYCNEVVALRKDASTGQIVMEGTLCPDYFRVRDLLYAQYEIL